LEGLLEDFERRKQMTEVQVTLEQVQELVQNNEEVRKSLQSTLLTPEAFTAFIETEDGKKVIQPIKDSFASQAINAWKNNNLDKVRQEAILSANPSDTPEQKRIKELELQFQAQQEKAIFAEQNAYAFQLANQKGIPTELASRFVGKNAEETLMGINSLDTIWKAALQVEAEKLMGHSPRGAMPDFQDKQAPATPSKSFKELSNQERNYLYTHDRATYERMKAQG